MVGFSHPFHTIGETFYEVLAETKDSTYLVIIFIEKITVVADS